MNTAFLITSASMIFFMQAGFILLECSAIRQAHYSDVIVKNILDSLTGAIGFWIAGFAYQYGEQSQNSFIGSDSSYYFTRDIDDKGDGIDLWVEWFFAFAFVNTASTIVSGLLIEKCRIEVYAAFSFLMSFIIYPVVAYWSWNEQGWLYKKGYQDFAGSGAIHMLGGITGLVGAIFSGARIRRNPGKL